jgi:hypothetical protein
VVFSFASRVKITIHCEEHNEEKFSVSRDFCGFQEVFDQKNPSDVDTHIRIRKPHPKEEINLFLLCHMKVVWERP